MSKAGRIFIVFSIVLFVFSVKALDRALGSGTDEAESAADAPAPAWSAAPEEDAAADGVQQPYAYLLKNENGRVMLYSAGSESGPVETAISYPDLPPEDRALLDSGIAIGSERQLLSVIEDYTG